MIVSLCLTHFNFGAFMFTFTHFRAYALALASAATLVACGGGGSGYTAETTNIALSASQQVPAIASSATGTSSLSLNRVTKELSGTVVLSGMTATAAHVHMGAAGTNGAVVFTMTLTATGATLAPMVLTDAQIVSYDAGLLYVNVHSAAFPGGELRGQAGREVFTAKLSGVQQSPAVSSMSAGVGSVILDPKTGLIEAKLTLTGFTATAAHIHTGALGDNGGVLVDMHSHAAGEYVGHPTTPLTAAEIASLRAGNLYFNAHSATNPGGEVRGQIGVTVGVASANGAQQVPANASTATGTGVVTFDTATKTITGKFTLVGTTATAGHIHMGVAGANGAVIVTLTDSGSGVWTVPATVLTAAQAQTLLSGGMYFNFHNATYAGGEVRGQIGF
jgi:hypothetical protein